MAKKRTKRKQKTVKNIGKILLAVGILTCFAIVISLGSFVIDAYGFDITSYKMDSSSVVYGVDKDGNPIEYEQLHGDVRRVWVDIENIPDFVQKAAISIEDERFYSHRGIDIKRTAGAIFGFITGTSDYGGSTITQQLVKNVTGDWDNSPTRKIREIFRALVVETKMNKEEILEYYLNIVYFGNGSNGVQMAAYTYFDKDIADLTVAEAAAIVGITQSPRNLDPFTYPENNKNRQMLVLGKMKDLGYLTEDVAVLNMIITAEYFGQPCNRTSASSTKLFSLYPLAFTMGAYSSAQNCILLYNTDEERFMKMQQHC